MTELTFAREAEHSAFAIAAAPVRGFAVPHLIIDDIFPEGLLAQINDFWPPAGCFQPEVPGNYVCPIYRGRYAELGREPQIAFWTLVNETLWPRVVAATAAALAGPAYEVFGDFYSTHLSLETPLTLMQADPTYPGHSMHTHFYHCPHWAFTMLLYIDPEDRYSFGTALHQLLPETGTSHGESSYSAADLDWRANVAMGTFRWDDRSRRYRDTVSEYKANRLFVFLDGPLALHSVPFDNPDHTPNLMRAQDGGRYARRRILRSHVKIPERAFYRQHSRFPFKRLKPDVYARIMAPNVVLSAKDQRYRDKVICPFFRERVAAYARAAEAAQRPDTRRLAYSSRHLDLAAAFAHRIASQLP